MNKKFEIIMADPPWFYGQRTNTDRFRGGARRHYDVMTDAEILALPVNQVTAKSAVLFLWATWPRLPLALKVIEAWGFKYKTCGFDWFKLNPSGGLFFGVGFYAKSNSEPCLLATKGRVLKPDSNAVSMALVENEAFLAERKAHSRKPDEVIRRVELLYPERRKLEMFARQERMGWVSWGNEVSDIPLTETVNHEPQSLLKRSDIKQVSLFQSI